MNAENTNRLILVPCDFSPVAYHAMGHGAYMSKSMNSQLLLLNIVSSDAGIPQMETKLNIVAEECMKSFGVRPKVMVRVGEHPSSIIKDVTNELNPLLVVLKTAGGKQTVRILSGKTANSAPFLVIQAPPKNPTLRNITFPINFLSQHDEKIRRMVLISEYYPEAVMRIITPSGKGTPKEKIITTNLNLMADILANHGVKTEIITHDNQKNTAETILEHSEDTDMIVIEMEKKSLFQRFIFGVREEKLSNNAHHVPVLFFNSGTNFRSIQN